MVTPGTWGEHMGVSITDASAADVDRVAGLGFGWIRSGIEESWSLSNFTGLLAEAHSQGLKVLACIQDDVDGGGRYNGWTLTEYAAFADWASSVADLGVDAIEIGNEMNNPNFNSVRSEDQGTAALLTNVTATRLKTDHPNLTVISNGWAPWGEGPAGYYPQNALPNMLDHPNGGGPASLANLLNGYGYHPYEMSLTLPPTQPTTNPAWNACFWLATAHQACAARGVPRPFWLTEYGFHNDRFPADPSPERSEDEGHQANFAQLYWAAFRAHRQNGVPIETLFWHTLVEGTGATNQGELFMGLYTAGGREKPAAQVLRALAAEPWSLVVDPDPPPPPDPDPDPGDPTPPPTHPDDAPLNVWAARIGDVTISDDPPYRWGEDGPELFGWDSMRTADVARANGHGLISSNPDYLDARDIDLPVLIDAATEVEALGRWKQLAAAWAPSTGETSISISTPERRYRYFGRPRRCEPAGEGIKLVRDVYVIEALCRFEATDPLAYGDERTITVVAAGAQGGLSYPHGYPMGWGSSPAGAAVVDNFGTAPSRRFTVTLIANGTSIADPRVSCGDWSLDFDLTIAADQTLVLDFARRRALLNGEASRSGTIRRPGSSWGELAPGLNTVKVNVTGTARAVVAWRPAWYS